MNNLTVLCLSIILLPAYSPPIFPKHECYKADMVDAYFHTNSRRGQSRTKPDIHSEERNASVGRERAIANWVCFAALTRHDASVDRLVCDRTDIDSIMIRHRARDAIRIEAKERATWHARERKVGFPAVTIVRSFSLSIWGPNEIRHAYGRKEREATNHVQCQPENVVRLPTAKNPCQRI